MFVLQEIFNLLDGHLLSIDHVDSWVHPGGHPIAYELVYLVMTDHSNLGLPLILMILYKILPSVPGVYHPLK